MTCNHLDITEVLISRNHFAYYTFTTRFGSFLQEKKTKWLVFAETHKIPEANWFMAVLLELYYFAEIVF